jgi:hypothetical protein
VDVPYIFPVGFLFILLIYLVTGVFSNSLFLTVRASMISSTFYQETCSLMVPTLMKGMVIHQVSFWSLWGNFALELFYHWMWMGEQELQSPLLEGPLQHFTLTSERRDIQVDKLLSDAGMNRLPAVVSTLVPYGV